MRKRKLLVCYGNFYFCMTIASQITCILKEFPDGTIATRSTILTDFTAGPALELCEKE